VKGGGILEPLVSVLLPVYNGEAYVRGAIESVLAQDYPNFEFIIADNASTDETASIIAEYSADERVEVVHGEETIPRLDNFVKVFSLASVKSRWLKFIGDDDRLLQGCLGEMVAAGERVENAGLVTSHYYDGERLVTGIVNSGKEALNGPDFLRRLLLEPAARATLFSPASLLVSHQAYRDLGPFRTDLLHADHELFYRILNRYNLAFVHKPLTVSGYHCDSGQAGSTARGFTFEEAYLIRYKHLPRYDQVKLKRVEVEKIKLALVIDSVGFMLARIARKDYETAARHFRKIPVVAVCHLPLALCYFLWLAAKKLFKGEKVKLFSGEG
jgi:glycosyltransferase involved in cell wall biosynthesis